ncbi:hypothetical protein EGW08_019438 [Elysia chlorotica]|uniref:Peroxisomal membrane protein PMP34 n=1 Tax=Elysia chlorotica TaxID=188477 RepID=A0A3S1AUU7_ELYCH|nr:hypothetical protein EGW08_019438 [Elysia chlorotica]
MYLGWFPVVSALCCSNFVYFYSFNGIKSVMLGSQKKARPLLDLSVAFISGCVNVLLTTPLWVANTRLKLQGAKLHTEHYNKKTDEPTRRHYAGILDCLLKMIKTEGVVKLWGGTIPSLLLATNPAIQFMVYEALKRYFKRILKVAELSGLLYFILGAVAKATATVITYPLQVVQSRLRVIYKIPQLYCFRTKGVRFLYKGMEAKLLQTVLTAALMFAIYEKIAHFIFQTMGLR